MSAHALLGVAEHEDDGVAAQKHLTDEAVLVHGLSLLRALARFGNLHGVQGSRFGVSD